ncbi:hypothetical protein [Mycolicibacterium sp. A43C]
MSSWIATLLDFDRDGDRFLAPQPGVPGMRLFGGLITAQDHRPGARRGRWHCYEIDSLGNSHSRGLVVGGFYDTAGALIANTSQQALWRL